jgi:biotin synthase
MFEELGLNVARQPDNGARPRPDNRSGWLEGETPAPAQAQADAAEADFSGLELRLWDPSTQLRFARKQHVPPRPDRAPNTAPASMRG